MSGSVHSTLSRSHPGARFTVSGDLPLDENGLVYFPDNIIVLSADRYESSAWTVTARVRVEEADRTPKRYFLKCATEDAGRATMEGEFWAMLEL